MTNVRMEGDPLSKLDEQSNSDGERELSATKSGGQKQGTSQIIKYIDLSKFKIEKCKNLANGRQHNIKHCRYYHTLKDRRRLLDFEFMSMGIDEIVKKAAHLCPKREKDLDKNKRPDEYYRFCIENLHYLMDQIYTPDLCDN